MMKSSIGTNVLEMNQYKMHITLSDENEPKRTRIDGNFLNEYIKIWTVNIYDDW